MNSTKQILSLAIALVIGVFLFYVFSNRSDMSGNFSLSQKKDIQNIIREYLVNDPDVFQEAAQAFQLKSQEEMMGKTKLAIASNSQIFIEGNAPVLGNPDGDVVLVEFLDYNCSHCKRMKQIINALVKANPSLQVVIREYPIFGEESLFAAKSALAADNQGKFKLLHEALLESNDKLDEESVLAIAKEKGLDIDQLQNDIDSDAVMEKLRESVDLATKLSIRGTPYFIILSKSAKDENGVEILPGASSQAHIQQMIEAVKKSQ